MCALAPAGWLAGWRGLGPPPPQKKKGVVFLAALKTGGLFNCDLCACAVSMALTLADVGLFLATTLALLLRAR